MYQGLIEQARLTLKRLAEAPQASSAATAAAEELEAGWTRTPLSIGLGGQEVVARTELVNMLCGARALDPAERSLGSPAIRIHRGPVTRFRVIRDDGSVQQLTMPPDESPDVDVRMEAEAVRGELAREQYALDHARRSVPALVHSRPAWWMVWLWVMRWLYTWRAREALTARRRATQTIASLETRLAGLEQRLGHVDHRVHDQRRLYFAQLQQLSEAKGVREVELELADGKLPEGIELVELTGSTRASAHVDAVVLVSNDAMYAPGTGDRAPVRIGELPDSIAALPTLLESSRALRLARRVRDRADAAAKLLDDILARAERGFQDRIARLEATRIKDPSKFVATQVARIRPQIVTSVQAVIEHASVHVGAALVEVATEWTTAIEDARTRDELRHAVERVERDWASTTERIAEEAQILVMGGVNGCGHDLYPMAAAPLDLDAEERAQGRSITILPINVLPSIAAITATKRSGVGQWFAGLVRSLDTRRAEVLDKVRVDAERLRERASADLLDVEPQIHASLGQAIQVRLADTVKRRMMALDRAIARERQAIAAERETLAPIVHVRDDVLAELRQLSAKIEQTEIALPATAAAATAALSMSGTWSLTTAPADLEISTSGLLVD